MQRKEPRLKVYRVERTPADDRGASDHGQLAVYVHEPGKDGSYIVNYDVTDGALVENGYGARGAGDRTDQYAARAIAMTYIGRQENERVVRSPVQTGRPIGEEHDYYLLGGVTHSRKHVVEGRDTDSLCGVQYTTTAKPAEGGIATILDKTANLCSNCRAALESRLEAAHD